MGRELEELLRQQVAQPAKSCMSDNGVSFLDQVICPVYDAIAAVCFCFFPCCSLVFCL